jgi:hypothetical protein
LIGNERRIVRQLRDDRRCVRRYEGHVAAGVIEREIRMRPSGIGPVLARGEHDQMLARRERLPGGELPAIQVAQVVG